MKKLFYLLLCLPLAFAACEPVEEPTPEPQPEVKDPVLTLTSNATLNFAAEGGEGVITYTLEDAVEGTTLSATCDAAWVTNVVAAENVTFTVAANTTEAERDAKVVVTYGKASFEVAVKQAGLEPEPTPEPGVEFVADMIVGEYYSNNYSDSYNYCLYLTNYGFSSSGNPYAGGIYYAVDLYGLEPTIDSEGYLTVPAGTYSYDPTGSLAEWTVGTEYSGYFAVNAEGTGYDAQAYYDDVTVVVTESSITVTAVVAGENHTAVYNAAPKFFVGKPVEGGEFAANCLDGFYYGTQYSATYNFEIILSDLGLEDGYAVAGGKYYQLDCYTDVEPTIDAEGYMTIPVGKYSFDADDSAAAWTIGNYYSAYFAINAEGTAYEAQAIFDDATLTVTETGAVLEAVIEGTDHVVVFNAAPKFLVEATRAPQAKVAKFNMSKRAIK